MPHQFWRFLGAVAAYRQGLGATVIYAMFWLQIHEVDWFLMSGGAQSDMVDFRTRPDIQN
jgi:hypothetical protein